MTQGFATFISRYFGEKDYGKMNKAIANAIWLSGLVAVVLTVAGLFLARPVLVLLKTPDDILDDSVVYLSTLIAGSLAVAGYNITAAILRALGDGKSPLIAMIIEAVLNIGLDLIAVFILDWGIFGTALASVLAQLIAFLYCLRQILKTDFIHLDKKTCLPDLPMAKELFAFGLPLALQYIIINVSGMVLQSTVNLQGSIFVAGYTATNKVYGLLECSAISLGFSATTFFSQNFGAKLTDRIRTGMKATVGIGIGMAVFIGGLMVLVGRPLLSLFIDQSEAGASQALTIGHRYLMTMSACLIILFLIYAYRSVLQSMGTSIPSMISGFTECAARVLMAKGLYAWLGQDSLYFAEPVAWLGSLVFIMGAYYALRSQYMTRLAQ
jgi:putative MATE family efflux protein